MTIRELVDAAERERLREDFEATFFVEAGAGTGKTTVLVSRVVGLIAAGVLETAGLVAITFTEAAAAELRGRIRSELEVAADDRERDDTVRERCREAAATIDLAAIQTIHAFAAALLRTYPIEARLPPGFEVWDDVQFSLAFDERFQIWLDAEATADEAVRVRRAALQRALLLGLRFDDPRALARAFQEHTDILPAQNWSSPVPTNTLAEARAMGQQLQDLERMIRYAKNGEEDPLVGEIRRLASGARRLREAGDELEALLALKDLPDPSTQRGRKGDFLTDENGVNAADRIKEILREVKGNREALLSAHRAAALGDLLDELRAFTLDFTEERRRQGVAGFHDLLLWARDLLRDNPSVRERARARFHRIFVDEFQDTDPLQAEIIWYLTANSLDEDWVRAPLRPGKLFVVGDPKQSIYRFRGADIRLVGEIFEKAGPRDVLKLRQNFRSARAVLAWANYHFDPDFVAEAGIQPPYGPLEPIHEGPAEAKVLLLGEAMAGSAAERRAAEAGEICALIRTAIEERWPVRDGETLRYARYDDVCLLMPTRTGLRVLEVALEKAGIPYRVEADTLVLDTQEVRDLLAALRSIDDPSDQVALVAALRSPAYGCSDAELLRWVEDGGTLDYERACDLTGPVADAFGSLRRFHELRQEHSAAWLIETFIRERMLAVQTFGYPHPREAWRRLRYLVAQARALDGAGRPGLRALVNWLEERQREGVRDQESPRPDSDEEAVRLLTVHGAKGLEFPIVILSDLGRQSRGQHGYVLRDRASQTLDVKKGDLATSGYARTAELEKVYDRAERVRLLYVAATRARDYLALSLIRKISKTGADDSDAGRIASILAEAPELATRFVAPVGVASGESRSAFPEVLPEAEAPEDYLAAEAAWQSERAKRIAASSELARLTLVDPVRRALAGSGEDNGLGMVVEGSNDREAPIAPAMVEGMGRDRAANAFLEEARQARRRWRGVPVGIEVDGVLLEGQIDLVFAREDGTLGILNCRTDPANPGSLAANAPADRLQAGACALAIQQATRKTVSAVGIVDGVPGGQGVVFSDVTALIAEAQAAITQTPKPSALAVW